MPDTAYEGAVYDSLLIVVKQTSPTGTSYSGNIGVGYMTDTVPQPQFFYIDTLPNVLSAGDSMVFRVDGFIFDPAIFREGGNVVVVWPITPVIPNDSLYIDVFFVSALGVGTPNLPIPEVKIFPNPVQEILNLQFEQNLRTEHVRIFDTRGALLYSSKLNRPFINTANLRSGAYYIEIRFRDAIPVRKSFLKAGG